eukprot:SAG31_NODE_11614_length_1013_cov_1.150985_1_plen_259_part_10
MNAPRAAAAGDSVASERRRRPSSRAHAVTAPQPAISVVSVLILFSRQRVPDAFASPDGSAPLAGILSRQASELSVMLSGRYGQSIASSRLRSNVRSVQELDCPLSFGVPHSIPAPYLPSRKITANLRRTPCSAPFDAASHVAIYAEARTDLVNPQHSALTDKLDLADELCEQVRGTREFRSNAAIFKGLSEAGLEQAKRLAVGISKYTPDAFVSKLLDKHGASDELGGLSSDEQYVHARDNFDWTALGRSLSDMESGES